MHTHTTIQSPLAIAGGLLAGGLAIAFLMRDAANGLTLDLCAMPGVVVLTTTFAILAKKAVCERHHLAASVLVALSMASSGYIVWETFGRRAEIRDTKTLVATDAVSQRLAIGKRLSEAVSILAGHRQELDAACYGGKGPACKGKHETIATWEAAVTGYEAKLRAIPVVVVDARTQKAGEIAGLMGFNAQTVRQLVPLLEPAWLPLMLEFGSIALFCVGIGHKRIEALTFERPLTEAEIKEQKKLYTADVELSDDERAVIGALRSLGGKVYRQEDLADALGVKAPEVSKRLSACRPEVVTRHKVGRQNVIELANGYRQ